MLDAEVGDDLARELRAVQNAAFGLPPEEVDGEDLARLRDWAADGVVVHAREAGRVVGAAVALPIRAGMTELVGIAVAEPARGRGVAAALTSATAALALARGARTPFLTPGDGASDAPMRRPASRPPPRWSTWRCTKRPRSRSERRRREGLLGADCQLSRE